MKVYILLEELDIDTDCGAKTVYKFRNVYNSYYDVIRFIQSIPKSTDAYICPEGGRGYFRVNSKNLFDKYDKEKFGDGINYLTDIQVVTEKKYEYKYFVVLYKEC